MKVVKGALHVSAVPSGVVCREEELKKVPDFCKSCVEREKSGSLYVCGCPGTGKTMVMEKVEHSLVNWSSEVDVEQPDVLFMNCTSLSNTSEVFTKILQKIQPRKKLNGSVTSLKHIQNIFTQDGLLPGKKMMLLVIDELDYLITKDRNVLHELFMLTTLPFFRCILIGIANAIDLADRFLPKLKELNCKPAGCSINISCLLKRPNTKDSSREAGGTSLHGLSATSPGTLCPRQLGRTPSYSPLTVDPPCR